MKFVPTSVTRAVGRQILTTKKNSPHIFFAAGVVGAVASTVLACRATLKLEKTVDDIHTDLDAVKALGRPSETGSTDRYPDREYYKDLTWVYAKSTKRIVRLYGPSAVLGTASIAALTGSHVQMTRRNTALTATLALLSQAYEDYRLRVREEIGEERELDIYRGVVEETKTVDGKKKAVKTLVNPGGHSIYAKCFDETNVHYIKDNEYNRIFIQLQQNYCNLQLQTRGHVFLNEAYDLLGFERTRAGAIVGWVYNGEGDNYIDFGMFDGDQPNFVNGLERSIWLDFNVDGVVYDKI